MSNSIFLPGSALLALANTWSAAQRINVFQPGSSSATIRGLLSTLTFSEAGAGMVQSQGGYFQAIQASTRTFTELSGIKGAAFAQGAGVITTAVGGDFFVERDPGAGANSVSYAVAARLSLVDSTGLGWGTGEGYGALIQQVGGGFTNVYGIYVDTLVSSADKYAFYGINKIHTDSDSEAARFVAGGTNGITAGPFTVITSITVKGGIVTALTGS